MNITNKIKIGFRTPSRIPRALITRILWLFRLYILRDEFTVALDRWNRETVHNNLRLNYPLTSESIVFDLGGYRGDFASDINQKYNCYVYLFEPVEKFYLDCLVRFENNKKISCFNYGLGSENGSFFINDDNDSSSLFKNNDLDILKKVYIKSFSEELDRLNITQIDLLKINIEGSEFFVLSDLISKKIISKINYLQIQFHTFFPNAKILREEIRSSLRDTHEEVWNYPFVWECWKRKI